MAFYSHHMVSTDGHFSHPFCGHLLDMYIYLDLVCTEISEPDFLCEVESETSYLNIARVNILFPVNQILPLSHVECPLGHMTLDFMACDLKSVCWSEAMTFDSNKWLVPSYTSCPAPLTSLPPSFECGSSDYTIAFSLVCNHRSDCLDSSDEKFCKYPACAVESELMCLSSKQVSYHFIWFCRH